MSGKRRGSSSTLGNEYIKHFHATDDFNQQIKIIRHAFHIPDYDTRSGVKKIHQNFDDLYHRLDGAFMEHYEDVTFRACIIVILARMCEDSILRDHIWKRGILKKLLPLLNIESTRQLALDALCIIATPGGPEVRLEIARLSPLLLQLMVKYHNEDTTTLLCLMILGRTLPPVLDESGPPDPIVLRTLNVAELMKVFVRAARRPMVPFHALVYCLDITLVLIPHFPDAIRGNLDWIKFMIAGFRSKRWDCRSKCLTALMGVHGTDPNVIQFDVLEFHPISVANATSKDLDQSLQTTMGDYSGGIDQCELSKYIESRPLTVKLFMKHEEDRDTYKLSHSLANYVTNYEFTADKWPFRMQISKQLPFKRFADALIFCADYMRDNLCSERDRYIHHILRTKGLLLDGDEDALTVAEAAVEKHPDVAWFHYVIASIEESVDPERCIRTAMSGLKCTITTPHIRHQLLYLVVSQTLPFAAEVICRYPLGQPWDEGVALSLNAVEAARYFILEAPPDHRHMTGILEHFILLLILVRGPSMNATLDDPDIISAQKKLQTARAFDVIWTGSESQGAVTRFVRQVVSKHYTQASEEWRDTIASVDADTANLPKFPPKPEEKFSTWLAGTTTLLETHSVKEQPFDHLYSCSFCGNPSAVLRKCSGCAKARYCNTTCQKDHWKAHKKDCRAKS